MFGSREHTLDRSFLTDAGEPPALIECFLRAKKEPASGLSIVMALDIPMCFLRARVSYPSFVCSAKYSVRHKICDQKIFIK